MIELTYSHPTDDPRRPATREVIGDDQEAEAVAELRAQGYTVSARPMHWREALAHAENNPDSL